MELMSWYSTNNAGTERPFGDVAHLRNVSTWCNRVYEEARAVLDADDEIRNIPKYVRYLKGNQWDGRRPKYKAAPVSNRLYPNLVQLVSYLTDIRQVFEPQAKDPAYAPIARKLKDRARSWFIDRDADMVGAMALFYSAIAGVGYVRQVWNPDLDGGEGDIELTVAGPLEVIPIKPNEGNLQNSYGLIYEKQMPLAWFRSKYPMMGDLVKADGPGSHYTVGDNSGGLFDMATSSVKSFLGFSARKPVSRESALPMGRYREFWLRDTSVNKSDKDVYVGDMARGTGYEVHPGERLYPRGRLIILGGDLVLFDGPNPHWHGRFPFAALRLNQFPGQWNGISEIRNQLPLQDIMNTVLAGILDLVKKAVNPPIQAPQNALSESQRRMMDLNQPGVRVYYNQSAGINPINYAPIPQLPPYVYQTLLFAREELAQQTGFLDAGSIAGKGLLPGADTLEVLSQGQQTLVRLKVRYIESFYREIGEQWIANAFQYYSTKRKLLTYGTSGLSWTDWEWNPAEITPAPLDPAEHWKSFKWTMLPGTLLKSQQEPERAMALQMRRMGDMSRKTLYKIAGLDEWYKNVEDELKTEGANMLLNMLRQKMSGIDGGGALAPGVLKEISNAITEKPEPV